MKALQSVVILSNEINEGLGFRKGRFASENNA